ncbi:MAG TPA: hypothetical protein VMT23_03500 [Candidatus Binatia bacterium]|nr:hypothetical protein [Candidatus Binatia bacterium]
MQILRRMLLAIVGSLFLLLLFTAAFDEGVVRTVGSPKPVKHILADSGIYSTIIPSLLDQAKQQSSDDGSFSLTNPIVKAAAVQTLSPAFIQKNAETIIDSVYAWLDGKTAEPDFYIDLSTAKAAFAESVATQVEQKAATLPVCTDESTDSSFDALSATCLPQGLSPQQAADSVKNSLLGGKGFLDNPVITAASIKNGQSGKSVFADQLKSVPKQYQRAKKSPYLLIGLSLIFALAIVFLSSSKQKGLRHLGRTLLIIGVFMLIFSWALNRVVTTEVVPKIAISGNLVLQGDIRNLATDLTHQIDRNYWEFGAAYAVIGALAIGIPLILAKRGSKTGPAPAETEAPKPQPPAAAAASTPAKKKTRTIKVQ